MEFSPLQCTGKVGVANFVAYTNPESRRHDLCRELLQFVFATNCRKVDVMEFGLYTVITDLDTLLPQIID